VFHDWGSSSLLASHDPLGLGWRLVLPESRKAF
jgi:hypothetical protein